ncbi:MAG: hypothetical protein LUP95_01490 [Euryarchaeota archaeon]|nr:hypothetical protein [Euryarchaeota archaeon]
MGVITLFPSLFLRAAAFVVPTTGFPKNVMIVNLGTFVGALCFLLGALLLLPERTHDPSG